MIPVPSHLPQPSTRAVRVAWIVAAVIAVGLVVWLVATLIGLSQRLDRAEEDRAALKGTVLKANDRLRDAGEKPVAVPVPTATPAPQPVEGPGLIDQLEIQQPEIQQPERQQPERQEKERQNPERQQDERQQAEVDQRERQEDEVQQDEVQDEETDDPEIQQDEDQEAEIQQDEVQNEEIDDPDPNSALTFEVEDNCTPADGQFVTDVGASWRRAEGTLTLVLTCAIAPVPSPGAQP